MTWWWKKRERNPELLADGLLRQQEEEKAAALRKAALEQAEAEADAERARNPPIAKVDVDVSGHNLSVSVICLRDLFAGLIMVGRRCTNETEARNEARHAYRLADAMLEVRREPKASGKGDSTTSG